MDFSALKTELAARGFDHLSSTRQGYYINAARAELDRMYLWPWREASATGTAPLTISDLAVVEAVTDTTNDTVLTPIDYRTLLHTFPDLSTAGNPTYYYTARPSSPEVATYPVSSSATIGVQYWKVTPDLSASSDTPASPTEAHYTIVDLAVRRAYRDSDNHAEAEAIQSEIDRAIGQLLLQYPPGIADHSGAYILSTHQDY